MYACTSVKRSGRMSRLGLGLRSGWLWFVCGACSTSQGPAPAEDSLPSGNSTTAADQTGGSPATDMSTSSDLDGGQNLADAAPVSTDAGPFGILMDSTVEAGLRLPSDAGESSSMHDARTRDAHVYPASEAGSTTWPTLMAPQIGTPELVSDTFVLAENPLWDHCHGQMLFVDVEASVIYAIRPDGTISVVRSNTNYANGLAFDREGRLVMDEMGGGFGGRITRLEPGGTLKVLADKPLGGGQLNTSDDLIIRSDGIIYFSDPVIPHGGSLSVSLLPEPLYRLNPGARTPEEVARVLLPNGVELSPDEKTLYLSAFLGGEVVRFDVAPDGALRGQRTFLPGLSNPDSMCLDAAGNVYVAVSQGLAVARPDGTPIALVNMSTSQGATNCGFGGEDGKTLYISAWNTLWTISDMPIPGLDWTNNQHMPCND